MSCGCGKNERNEKLEKAKEIETEQILHLKSPTDQCIKCAQKHLDEAYMLWKEYGYTRMNRRMIRGSLRLIVMHTALKWNEIAFKARQLALAVQDEKETEADWLELCTMVDDAFDKEK